MAHHRCHAGSRPNCFYVFPTYMHISLPHPPHINSHFHVRGGCPFSSSDDTNCLDLHHLEKEIAKTNDENGSSSSSKNIPWVSRVKIVTFQAGAWLTPIMVLGDFLSGRGTNHMVTVLITCAQTTRFIDVKSIIQTKMFTDTVLRSPAGSCERNEKVLFSDKTLVSSRKAVVRSFVPALWCCFFRVSPNGCTARQFPRCTRVQHLPPAL